MPRLRKSDAGRLRDVAPICAVGARLREQFPASIVPIQKLQRDNFVRGRDRRLERTRPCKEFVRFGIASIVTRCLAEGSQRVGLGTKRIDALRLYEGALPSLRRVRWLLFTRESQRTERQQFGSQSVGNAVEGKCGVDSCARFPHVPGLPKRPSHQSLKRRR
jgi:hypothetical protein